MTAHHPDGSLRYVTQIPLPDDAPSETGASFYDVRALQLDFSLAIVGDVTVLEAVYRSSFLQNVYRKGGNIYLSVTSPTVSFNGQRAFLVRISEGIMVNTEEPNITEDASFTIYPNPTTTNVVNLSWEQPIGSAYELHPFTLKAKRFVIFVGPHFLNPIGLVHLLSIWFVGRV